MSNNALRTARKIWKQIKYNLEDRSVLELGSADDDLIEEIDAEQIKEIDADQIKDIEDEPPFRPVACSERID